MKKFKLLASIFFLFNMIASIVKAQCGLYPINLDQKVNESEVILEGRVVQQKCYRGSNINKIFTLNTIEVISILKGNVPHQINIVTAGGRLNNQLEIASSLLSLNVGQLGLFFLNKEMADPATGLKQVFSVFSSAQGFYKYNLAEQLVFDVFNEYTNVNKAFYTLLEDNYGLNFNSIFDTLLWGNSNTNSRLTVINNFAPLTINAGTGEQITINGFGFGSTRNTSHVLFKNTDDGGNTEIPASASQYISWSDTKIVVVVPHKAGTGKIVVEKGPIQAQSSAVLKVNYAIINTGTNDLELVHFPKHVARNANKGYIWNISNTFDEDSIAKSNFLISFKKWRCKTYINWTIGNTTNVQRSERDTMSIVSFDETNELPVGVLGLCYGYYSGCSEDDWYIEEQDLLFKKTNQWHFGDEPIPQNKLDFQSVALHEMGHAHQLAHVINGSDLMHYSISIGVQKRDIEAINLDAAQWIINRSTASDLCDQKRMQLLDGELCNDESFGYFNTLIYPNPFNEFLNIDFYLNSDNALQVELFDVTGKLVASYINASAQKGFFPVVFDVPQHLISAGVYIVKIQIGEEKLVKKVIKQ